MSPTVRTRREGLTINHGNVLLLTDRHGEIRSSQEQGLFANHTRFIRGYRLLINGNPWKLPSMLGLTADAPHGRLYVKPTLPDWAPSVELERLRVGAAQLGLRFWREGDETRFEVTSQEGGAVQVLAGPGT